MLRTLLEKEGLYCRTIDKVTYANLCFQNSSSVIRIHTKFPHLLADPLTWFIRPGLPLLPDRRQG